MARHVWQVTIYESGIYMFDGTEKTGGMNA